MSVFFCTAHQRTEDSDWVGFNVNEHGDEFCDEADDVKGWDDDNGWRELDEDYDTPPQQKGGQVNNRMGTLNRQAGIINRYRNKGIL